MGVICSSSSRLSLYRISSHALKRDESIQSTARDRWPAQTRGNLSPDTPEGQGGDHEEGRRVVGRGQGSWARRLPPMLTQCTWGWKTTRQMDFSLKREHPYMKRVKWLL